MTRRVALALALSLAGGCTGTADSPTFDQPCLSDDECLGGERCVRTASENLFGLPGLCRGKNDDCKQGYQLDCACDVNGQCPGGYPQFQVSMTCDTSMGAPRCVMADPDAETTGS